MKKIFRNRLDLFVNQLQEGLGRREIDLELKPKVKQVVFIAVFIAHGNEHKSIKPPLEIHSYTHELQSALIADTRIELVGGEGCELIIYFNGTLGFHDTIIIRITSRLKDVSEDDLTHHIKIPIKNTNTSSREFVLPEQFPSGEFVTL